MNDLAPGIDNIEKAQLDHLSAKVAEAKYEVNQQQANMNAMASKSSEFTAFLSAADLDKKTALANLNVTNEIDASLEGLASSTSLAKKQSDKACNETLNLSAEMATLIKKLIFSVEIIDTLGQLVTREKAINKLIPDSLIGLILKASTDAQNAIALTLTALQSCYAAEASATRSKQVIDLQAQQLSNLVDSFKSAGMITEPTTASAASEAPLIDCTGLLSLSENAYEQSVTRYQQTLVANNIVNKQLAYAQQQLAKSTTSLNSWQAGLAAATAAAAAA